MTNTNSTRAYSMPVDADAQKRPSDRDLDFFISRGACNDLLTNVCRGFDRCDPQLISAAFCETAKIDYGTFAGNAEDFGNWAMSVLAPWANTQHLISNFHFQMSGDQAASETCVSAHHHGEGDTGKFMLINSRYLNRFVRGGEGWKISWHTVIVDSRAMYPVSHRLPKGVAWGRRDRDDPSYAHFSSLPETD